MLAHPRARLRVRTAPMTHTPLYRSEVLEAKRNRWLGSLILRQPMSHWAMTWIAIGTVAIAVAFLCFGEYARKIRIEGTLIEGTLIEGTGIDTPTAAQPATADGVEPANSSLEAELLVPENLLASIPIGGEVLLRYPAYPHQHYGQYHGRIVRISRQPVPTMRTGTADAAVGHAQSTYRATVALDRQRVRDDSGVERDLRPGLGVEADIVLEKHRLYEWLLEPFARLRERISA
jgi:hypothetical protein